MKRWISFLVSSGVSLLFILVLILLLTLMPQGGTLIIDLFNCPYQTGVFVILFSGFALVLSHYPVYIHEYRRSTFLDHNDTNVRWNMSAFRFLGFGFINYVEKKSPIDTHQFSFVRKIIGIGWYFGLFYIMACVYYQYQEPMESTMTATWVFVVYVLYVILFYFFHKVVRRLQVSRKGIDRTSALLKYASILWVLLLVILVGIVSTYNWHANSFLAFVLFNVYSLLHYSLFVVHRRKMQESSFIPLSFLGSDKGFIYFIVGLGMLSWSVIFYGYQHILTTTPILILLAYFFLFYGALIVLLKHHFYYSQESVDEPWYLKKIWSIIAPSIFILFPIIVFIISVGDNKLHELPIYCEKENPVTEAEYFSNFFSETRDTVYFVSSYGGGLKANAWNLLLMDTWAKKDTKYSKVLNRTISHSAVSGGALGQTFFTALKSKSDRSEIIDTLITCNFLTIDLSYLFSYDLIREFVPMAQFEFNDDRAMRAFKEYGKILQTPEFDIIPYRDYWAGIYRSSQDGTHTPILIMNSAATHLRQAVGCSIELNSFDDAFPRADNLSSIQSDRIKDCSTQSISFAHMASCTNRFPIFSPAAKIPSKGYYIDGGYFENSGVLSSWNFYQYLKNKGTIADDQQVVFINIINDQGSYIEHLFETNNLKKEIEEAGEISAMIGTVTSIDVWPNYIRDVLAREANDDACLHVREVYLPHRITVEDIDDYIKGRISGERDRIKKFITEHDSNLNKGIDKYINSLNIKDRPYSGEANEIYWHTVEPPLARILTEPAVEYMKAMIFAGLCYPDSIKTYKMYIGG